MFILLFVMINGLQPTLDINYANFNIIKEAYNKQNFELLYNIQSQTTKDQIKVEAFIKAMSDAFNQLGKISYWVLQSQNVDYPYFVVAYAKNLLVGAVYWQYDSVFAIDKFVLTVNQYLDMTEYIINNPKNSALSIVQDGQLVLSYNGDRFQSLCSVVKITVAIEFSRQVTLGELDDQQLIDIAELDKYYIQNFDNAHASFKEWIIKQNYVQDNKVKLYYVNLGMIIFSSNANTEFLQTLLTFQKIEQTQNLFNLKQSRSVYLVSSMLAFYNFDNLSEEAYIAYVKTMQEEDFIEKHLFVHSELVQNSEQSQGWLADGHTDLLRPEVLSVQASFLTYSSTDQYSFLMDKLNQGLVFNKEFYDHFYPIIGYVPMSNPNQVALYNHAGVSKYIIFRLKEDLALYKKILTVFSQLLYLSVERNHSSLQTNQLHYSLINQTLRHINIQQHHMTCIQE
ncbi:hypothetical protein pb186bvf_010670 [Paramecium bursaria]